MAIPANPSTYSLVADAMNQAIHTLNATSSSAVVTNNALAYLDNVRMQLWGASTYDRLLDTTSVLLTATGSSTVALPTDFDHETELRIFDGPSENRGCVQAATSTAIQVGTEFSADVNGVVGSWVFILGGTGSAQEAQIASYNDSTKWATMQAAFSTTPDTTSTYLIASQWWDLRRLDYWAGTHYNQRPSHYRLVSTTCYVMPPADQVYPIRIYYGANLTRVDDNGFVFIRHMRERRAYWIQGLRVETLRQFDDDRYASENQLWLKFYLPNYAGKNPVYTQATFVR